MIECEVERIQKIAIYVHVVGLDKPYDPIRDVEPLGVDRELEQLSEIALVVHETSCFELEQRLEKAF